MQITPQVRAAQPPSRAPDGTRLPEASEFDPFFQGLTGDTGLVIAQERIDLARLYTIHPRAEHPSDGAERLNYYIWRDLGLAPRLNIIDGLEEIERMAERLQTEGEGDPRDWENLNADAATLRESLQEAQYHRRDPQNWWEYAQNPVLTRTPLLPRATIQTSTARPRTNTVAQVKKVKKSTPQDKGDKKIHETKGVQGDPEPDDSGSSGSDLDSDDSDFKEDDDEDEKKKADEKRWDWEPEELDWSYDKMLKWIEGGNTDIPWTERGWKANSRQFGRLKQHHRRRFHGKPRHQPRFPTRNKTDFSKKAELKPLRKRGTRRLRLAFFRRFVKIKEFRELVGWLIPGLKQAEDMSPEEVQKHLDKDAVEQRAQHVVEWRKMRLTAGKRFVVRFPETAPTDADETEDATEKENQSADVEPQSVVMLTEGQQNSAWGESSLMTGVASADGTAREPPGIDKVSGALPISRGTGENTLAPAPAPASVEPSEPADRHIGIDESYDDED